MSWFDGARARLHLLFARRAAESRMDEELRFHVDMETERLVRDDKLDPEEARRRALATFGGVTQHREQLRDGRGLAWISGVSLDLKLGLRMLAKYPGLTVVSVVGLAIAVAIGAVSFSAIYTVIDGTLPIDEGNRIVLIRSIDTRRDDDARRTHLRDLAVWREALTSVVDLGAFRTVSRNLLTPGGRPESVRIAEMSAAGFRIARTPPVIGRYFNDEDERRGAAPVVVIGYDVWQNRFGARPDIVGQTLDLGDERHTVIGVMPAGFGFPVNNRIWTPLRLNPADYTLEDTPGVDVFARLAPGATLSEARRQLTTIAQRLASSDREGHEYVRPRVVPYSHSFVDNPALAWMFHLIQVLVSMLLVVIGTNVAILVYARTAARTSEIAVRTALGASRARVVGQLFAEALVLSSLAATIGVVGARFVLVHIDAAIERMGGEQLPYWVHFGITPGVILYASGLAVLAAVIVGVVPALKATRSHVHSVLQHVGLGDSGMRLGRTWTFMVVAQVTVAVAIMPIALEGIRMGILVAEAEPPAATKHFITATLHLDQPDRSDSKATGRRSVMGKLSTVGAQPLDAMHDSRDAAIQFETLRNELIRRLSGDAGVSRVVLASVVPGNEPETRFEVDTTKGTVNRDTSASSGLVSSASVADVDLSFFEAFGVPLLAGRGFESADFSADPTAVIVSRSFAERAFAGANPVGRRLRLARRGSATGGASRPWQLIVGVVADFPKPLDSTTNTPKVYHPLVPAGSQPIVVAVRTRAEAASFTTRLYDVTIGVSPMLRLTNVATLDQTFRDNLIAPRLTLLAVGLLTSSVLLLSAGGIYALMSFTITRRRREIGIRVALGAGSRRVLMSVLSKAMAQIATGIVIGIVAAGLLDLAMGGELTKKRGVLLFPSVVLLMTVVGLVAAFAPARRALEIQPTEALRAE